MRTRYAPHPTHSLCHAPIASHRGRLADAPSTGPQDPKTPSGNLCFSGCHCLSLGPQPRHPGHLAQGEAAHGAQTSGSLCTRSLPASPGRQSHPAALGGGHGGSGTACSPTRHMPWSRGRRTGVLGTRRPEGARLAERQRLSQRVRPGSRPVSGAVQLWASLGPLRSHAASDHKPRCKASACRRQVRSPLLISRAALPPGPASTTITSPSCSRGTLLPHGHSTERGQPCLPTQTQMPGAALFPAIGCVLT